MVEILAFPKIAEINLLNYLENVSYIKVNRILKVEGYIVKE